MLTRLPNRIVSFLIEMSSSAPDENVPFSPLLQFMETGWIHIVEALAVGLIVFMFIKLFTSYRSQATSNQPAITPQTIFAPNQGLGQLIDSDLGTLTNTSPKMRNTPMTSRDSNPDSRNQNARNGSDDNNSATSQASSEGQKQSNPLNHYIDDFFK